jgi:hypothetical protein
MATKGVFIPWALRTAYWATCTVCA